MIEVRSLSGRMARAFFLSSPDRRILVDTGTHQDVALLQSLPRPDLILITHVHVDHAGGAAALREHWGCPVAVPAQEAGWAREGYLRVPPALEWWARGAGAMAAVMKWLKVTPFEPDFTYDENFELGLDARLIATPGHSPDHHSVYVEGKWLLSGDAIAGSSRVENSPRLSCFGEDLAAMQSSAKKIAVLPFERLLPCHGQDCDRDSVRKWTETLP